MSIRAIIQQSIRRSNLKTVIISMIAIATGVGFFAFSTTHFLSGYFGPTVVLTEETLMSVSPDSLPLFKTSISSDDTHDLNVSEETTTTINGISIGTSTTAHFGVLLIGDHLLLVKTSGLIRENVTEYSGVLVAVQADQVGRDLYSDLAKEAPEFADAVLPLILDVSYPPWPWFAGLAVEIGLIFFGFYNMRTVFASHNFSEHPIVKKLERFGDSETIMNEIDDEMLQGQPVQVHQLHFTRNWLINKRAFNVQATYHRDVMWVCKYVRSTNGIKSYSAIIRDRSGELIEVAARQKKIDAMIAAVLQRAPWAIVGYNPAVESAWRNNREGFIRTVDERRAQVTRPQ
jgi:hypothetical protein